MKTARILRTMLAVLTLLVVNLAWGATYNVLYDFHDSTPGALVLDGAGNLYGTTGDGGAYGFGSVYELSPSSSGWTRTILYSFKGGRDGNQPNLLQRLVFDKHGNLYGTTIDGGPYGVGNVFRLTPQKGGGWTECVIHSFDGAPATNPWSGLIVDSAGNLYGTTYGTGTAFELSRTSSGKWKFHILHEFGSRTKNDGSGPLSELAFDPAGNLYGTTYIGGVPDCGVEQIGCGTVFKFTPTSGGGWHYSVIYRFKGGADGDQPRGNVVSDRAGNLYGQTIFGGKNGVDCQDGCGTAFELSPNSNGTWKHAVIHTFAGYPNDGGNPSSGVTLDPAGHIFAETDIAGAYENGTVFKLKPQSGRWHETLLYSFVDEQDGGFPSGGLALDSAGNLYGTTQDYANGPGLVFEVTP